MNEDEKDEQDEATSEERNLGTQPLDALMLEHELINHDLVAKDTIHLTHKAIARARKGRKLTKNTQQRVLAALNAVLKDKGAEQPLPLLSVFNYKA